MFDRFVDLIYFSWRGKVRSCFTCASLRVFYTFSGIGWAELTFNCRIYENFQSFQVKFLEFKCNFFDKRKRKGEKRDYTFVSFFSNFLVISRSNDADRLHRITLIATGRSRDQHASYMKRNPRRLRAEARRRRGNSLFHGIPWNFCHGLMGCSRRRLASSQALSPLRFFEFSIRHARFLSVFVRCYTVIFFPLSLPPPLATIPFFSAEVVEDVNFASF